LSTRSLVRLITLAVFLTSEIFALPPDESIDPLPLFPTTNASEGSVQWGSLIRQASFFLSLEHGFRVLTDPDIRNNLGGKFIGGYANSLGNLHGWADGDPFLVNYIGHPIQGAVAGDIWIHNDPRYRNAEFGLNRQYWIGRARATAFSWVYSQQFEIGPISEATIGHVQSRFPQQGFVDQVVTPVAGMWWMIAEDAIDRYVIARIERKTSNRNIRILARSFLNPGRSFANVMETEKPWHRDSRGGTIREYLAINPPRRARQAPAEREPSNVPGFEFAVTANQMARENCVGGGAAAVFNFNPTLGIETDVSGCKRLGLGTNLSGDLTTFVAGPRLTMRGTGRWTPWVHLLVGGEKATQELLLPDVKATVMAAAQPGTSAHLLHDQYTRRSEATGFAMAFGGGLDWMLNSSMAFRLGHVDYFHTWMPRAGAEETKLRAGDLRVTTGFVVRMGGTR
jgi:hypothetical protein